MTATEKTLNPCARLIEILIGRHEYILRVSHKDEIIRYTLVDRFSDFGPQPKITGIKASIWPLDPQSCIDLINSGRLYKLTQYNTNNRLGWADLGVDGEIADLYVMLQ